MKAGDILHIGTKGKMFLSKTGNLYFLFLFVLNILHKICMNEKAVRNGKSMIKIEVTEKKYSVSLGLFFNINQQYKTWKQTSNGLLSN